MSNGETPPLRTAGRRPTESVQCNRCGLQLSSAASVLVHYRDCRPSSRVCPVPKPMKKKRLFTSENWGLGAGGAPRREDVGVLVPAASDEHDTVENPPYHEALGRLASECDILEPDAEWTSEATTEEVTEAMRRVLLDIADATGAKTADLVIKLLHHPSFNLDAFKLGVSSYRDVRDDADTQVEQELLSLRFEKEQVIDNAEQDAAAGMWRRDAVEVVRRQIARLTPDSCDLKRLITKPESVQQWGDDGTRLFSHPMSTPEAERVVNRVRDAVMTACAAGVPGVVGWEDGYDFVCFLQLYSDKSSQTLKTSSHTHFPLHVAVMNTSLSMKEDMVREGECVVGYLPTDIVWDNEEANIWDNELEDAVAGRGSRCSRLRILQNALEACLKPVLSQTLSGFEVRDATGLTMRCHPLLWSYVTDLPEGWDISSAVHGRCARCDVKKDDLCSTKKCDAKNAMFFLQDFDELDRLQSAAQGRGSRSTAQKCAKKFREEMWERSVAPVRPYLLSLGDNYGVDLFRCLRYEVMHNIHLGMTRTLLVCMSERLRSKELISSEFAYAKAPRNDKKFSAIRTTVLRSLNNAMELMDRQSPTIDFKVSFRSQKKNTTLNGLFQDTGLASMLEANDYARVLQVMPFLAATCDRMCGEPGTITRLFVEYVEIVFVLNREKQPSVAFSSKVVSKLRRRICRFVLSCRDLFAKHQKSELAIPKVHALFHAADDMEAGGLLGNYRADAYECNHKNIKGAFGGQSRRGEQGHVEALGAMERAAIRKISGRRTRRGARLDVVSRISKPRTRVRGKRTQTKVDAMDGDTVAITRGRVTLCAGLISRFLSFYVGHGCLAQRWPRWAPRELREFVGDLGGPRAFKWFMEKLELGPEDVLTRSNSAYASGHPSPVCERNTRGERIMLSVDRAGAGDAVEGQAGREVQRIVAAHSFHGTKHPVQNFVMVEGKGHEETMQHLHPSVQDKYTSCVVRTVWIAKVLAIVRRTRKFADAPGVRQRQSGAPEDLALIQYMEVSQDKWDDVDEALGCAKLQWAQEDNSDHVDKNFDKMRCVYGVVNVETIRGLAHVVRGDYGLGSTKTYRCEGDRHWSKCWFYVNRFKLERRGASVFVDDQP